MIAERSATQVADTLALLTSAYKGKPVIEAIIRAFANRTQELEDALWDVADSIVLPASLATRPPWENAFFDGDEISVPGEIGFFLRCVVAGTNSAALPPALTVGDPTYAPSPRARVVDGGVTWEWFLSGNPYGFFLDALGEIAGEPRLNRTDTDYTQAVRVALRVNRSRGRVQDILDVMNLLMFDYSYSESNDEPQAFRVDVYGVTYPATIAKLLGRAKGAGVHAYLGYSPNPRTGTFRWNASKWADSTGSVHAPWGGLIEAQ